MLIKVFEVGFAFCSYSDVFISYFFLCISGFVR